ncbi:DedA family protein [Antarcticirhabdus aurantiaca]|uniref:DedA family protein n=1 Tax=Antarcticirhabdus aurantiaca TaxID=2606717 RepID=A0ACD4NKH7_9HYPH|nr:DedA family protein [Antarcticirhabdus aurantiaca]WAJ27181.1 DedA family protein [Jeongeuplla avenae]
MTIETLIADYGLPAICFGAGAEGETVAILAGVVAHRGTLPFWQVTAAVAIGSFVADQIFFACGRYFRESRFVARLHEKPFFARAIAEFDKRPTLFTFGFRFVYGLRTISPVAIGTTQLPASRFVLINAAAAAIWALLFVSLGYVFGQGIEAIFGRLPAHLWLLVGVVGAAVLALLLAVAAHRRRAAASPGTPSR